jgi:aminomethyltransferase
MISPNSAPPRETALHAAHTHLGARLVPFAGWSMPVQYSSIREEHLAVRNGAGIFDVSHMGEFVFQGQKAIECLQYLTTNNLESLAVGSCHYSFFLTESGCTVDDTMIYRVANDEFLAVVNAGNVSKDWAHLQKVAQKYPGADIRDCSEDYALLALQGPQSLKLVQEAISTDLSALPFHSVVQDKLGGADVLIATSGYTGENGLEIFAHPDRIVNIWNQLESIDGITPCGLGARDTLRLEASLVLYEHELDEDTSPIEARLGFAVSKSGGYVGSRAVAAQRAAGPKKLLVMIEMMDRAIPRQGYPILSEAGEEIGAVTSGSLAPYLEKNIGMGYVKAEYARIGNSVGIGVRDRVMKAVQVKRPFYQRPKRV